MSYLLDINILIRAFVPTDSQHPVVTASLLSLSKGHEDVFICPQNVIEFWGVATRPLKNNGVGWTPKQAQTAIEQIQKLFQWAPDTPTVYDEWYNLAVHHGVSGKNVHDTRLAAVAKVYSFDNLLTINVQDFQRFTWLNVVHPQDVPII